MAAISGSAMKLTNADHTAKGAATYRTTVITPSAAKNTVHARVTCLV